MPENKILLLSKCVGRRFAEMLFYDGVLHFGYPSEWIKKAEDGNVGQGDLLEGVYTNENRFWNFFRRWFPRLVRDKETGTKYLRSRSIVNWPCYCLYSISEQTKSVGREGDCVEYDMSEAYAQDFSGEETWENRFKTGFPDRKAMVQKLLSVSKATATRLLQKLEIVLEQVGHGAGAYYRIRNY